MAWNLSTGMKKAMLSQNPSNSANLLASTISLGDGDGTGSTDTINDSGSGLGVFAKHDYVLIIGGTQNNVMAKVLTATAAKLEIVAGSFSAAESAGSARGVVAIDGGSVEAILKNSAIDLYSGTRPTDADTIESGTKLLPVTLDGGAFSAGVSLNGLNLGDLSGTTLKRATDPETGATEIWRGAGIADGTVGWARYYDNSKTTGASTTAIRMDGVVATSGADLNMANGTGVVTGVYSEVSDVSATMGTS